MRIFVQNALLMTIVKIKALTSVTHQQVNAKRKLENLVILVFKKENVIMIWFARILFAKATKRHSKSATIHLNANQVFVHKIIKWIICLSCFGHGLSACRVFVHVCDLFVNSLSICCRIVVDMTCFGIVCRLFVEMLLMCQIVGGLLPSKSSFVEVRAVKNRLCWGPRILTTK